MAALYWFMTIITDQFENKLKILIKEEGIVHFEKKYPHKYWIQKYKKKKTISNFTRQKKPKNKGEPQLTSQTSVSNLEP